MCGVGDGPKVQATQQPALKTIVGLRPSFLSAPAAARVLLSLIWGITTGCLSYAPKGKLPAGVCLIIIGTEGYTVPNKLNRYMLGSDTPKLKKNQDGSFTIYIQADDPEGDKEFELAPRPSRAVLSDSPCVRAHSADDQYPFRSDVVAGPSSG